MKYTRFPVTASLQPFIECYYVWEGQPPERLEIQTPPSARGALVINFGDPAWAYQDSANVESVPDSFICGLFTTRIYRVVEGNVGMAGIVFRPSAIHNFFGIRMSRLVNSRMPLSLLLGDLEKAVSEQVRKAANNEDRAKVLEAFALTYLTQALKKVSIIDETIDYMEQKDGGVTVTDVAEHFGISRRYLEKQFLTKVGVSPKFYSRILRFSRISYTIARAEKIDWQEIVHEGGFHDQSHFFKDFMEFNGVSPTEYREKHQELIRFLKT